MRDRRRSSCFLVMVVLSSMLLSACSVFDVVNAFNPDSASSVEQDVVYGDHSRQSLDVYSPLLPADDAVTIVFFYGGGWDSGNRTNYEFVARKLAAMGHFVVIPDYRLYPEVTFPEFVKDAALATAYVLKRPMKTGQGKPVFLMGHSAGAQIAMLVAMDNRYLTELGHGTDELAGVIGLAGPYDFLPITSPRLNKIFPTPSAQHDSQPINFIDNGDPPVFLAHGDQDKRVWLKNSVNMAEAISGVGGRVTLKVYPGITHTGMIKPFIPFMNDDTGLLDDIVYFISKPQIRANGI